MNRWNPNLHELVWRPMTTSTRIAIATASLLLLAACAAPAGAPEASSPDASSSPSPHETEPVSTSPDPAVSAPEGVPQAAWDEIMEDLAPRVDGSLADLTVVKAERTNWNDGSLGCPQPGQVYTQALVDGFQVILEVVGREFDYRVGAGSNVRLCEP
jgi:hypothetical protein